MKFATGRKIALGFYIAAIATALLRGLIHCGTVVNNVLLYGLFILAGIGFLVSYSVCRCWNCKRVVGARFRKIEECPYCHAKVYVEIK